MMKRALYYMYNFSSCMLPHYDLETRVLSYPTYHHPQILIARKITIYAPVVATMLAILIRLSHSSSLSTCLLLMPLPPGLRAAGSSP